MNNHQGVQGTGAMSLPDPVRLARPPRRLRDAFEPIAMHDVWCRQTQ